MKKIFYIIISIVLLNTMMLVNAQFVKNDFMDCFLIGSRVERGTYAATGAAPILKNRWNLFDRELISGNPTAPGNTPLAVAPLTYSGYIDSGKEKGLKLSKITGGGRTTTYSLTEGNEYKNKSYYISFLLNVDASTTADRIGVIGFSGDVKGAFIRAVMTVTNSASSTNYKLGISPINGGGTVLPAVYNYGETYLVVLKYDMIHKEVSLFVNPANSSNEPIPLGKIAQNAAPLDAIRGISVFQRDSYEATISGIRFFDSWEGDSLLLSIKSVVSNIADYGKVIKVQYYNIVGVEICKPIEKNIYIRLSTFENGKTIGEKILFTKGE